MLGLKKKKLMNNIKKTINLIKKKKLTIGAWLQVSNADSAEIIGHANFDWVAIDFEHGTIKINELTNVIRALELGQKLTFVRIANKNPNVIGNILDSGARGLIVPNIESREEIESIIEKTFYPPIGKRGVGFSRANRFGEKINDYKNKQKDLIVIAMIESQKGYENLEDILRAKNLSGVFIGPYDLSASMNLLGKFENKKFKDTINKIIKVCKKYKKLCGIHVVENNSDLLKRRIKEGYKFIAYSTDTVILNSYKINL